jgi:flagellin-like hook-associated protein FlgL
VRITYDLLAMSARQTLNRDFRTLNAKTNDVLANVGIYRSSTNASASSLSNLVRLETAAINNGIRVANDRISSCQVADEGLADLHATLLSMRDIVEDVALGKYKKKQLAAKDEEYQALVEDVNDILADTEYGGEKLLSGYDAVVSLNLDAVTDLSMKALPDGALATVSIAIADVTGARNELVMAATAAQSTMSQLEEQADEVTDFEARVSGALAAMAVVEALMEQLTTQLSDMLSAQANTSPWSVSRLLS